VAGYPVVGTMSGDDGQPRPGTPRPFRTIKYLVGMLVVPGCCWSAEWPAVHGKEKVYGSIP
jgi:hypothetical protein